MIGRGSRADDRRGGARGGGCRVEAGEVLDDATAEDGVVQGAPVDADRQVERVDLDGVLQGDWMKTSKTTLLNLR